MEDDSNTEIISSKEVHVQCFSFFEIKKTCGAVGLVTLTTTMNPGI